MEALRGLTVTEVAQTLGITRASVHDL
ncbi:helix-turn-helix domain-containing protein [Arthrobacter sp. ISL-72]|nr:helix-turn-helix domain-containing protein [Arthrobacter sp. ISL-72]